MSQEMITLRDDLRASLVEALQGEASLSDRVNEAVASYLESRQNEKLDREIAAFVRLQPTLHRMLPDVWVAIHDEQVVDHDADRRLLYRRIRAAYGAIPVLLRHVDNVTGEDIWFRTPSTGKHSS